jgi:LuxR family maltose regulon positive regulatory protein
LSTDLLASKLTIPALRPALVPRPRLIQRLNQGLQAGHRLTLVSAPAGFGKTTLVVDWLRQTDLPAAWLSLDEADNDLPRFLGYLAAAFHQADEEIGGPLLNALQTPQPPAAEKAQSALLNEIARRVDPLILVLDEYHLISEPAVLQLMEFLIQHQPAQLHLVLTTREDPDFPLARLRARDQLTEIRTRDLRFTRDETDAFLRHVMGLEISDRQLAVMDDRTEGWVAGLQLAGLSMQGQEDPAAFITDFSGSHRYILDYLTDEVLQQQPDTVRSFLLRTSILDRLCGPLCDALTGRTDSDQVLAHMEAANLFLTPLDEARRWYRYHPLFADLLRSQLTRLQPEWIPELHHRASGWLEANGEIQGAVEHALQASDPTLAGQLIERHAMARLYQGEVTLVAGWFDRLPEAALEFAPMLCIHKAWALVLIQRGARREDVERALAAAEHALDRVDADKALRALVAGHAASIRAFLPQTYGLAGRDPEERIALSQEALRLLPVQEKAIRSVCALNIGVGYKALADFQAASLAFEQALEDGLAGGNLYVAIYGPINLIEIALLVGNLRGALQRCDANIQRFDRMLAGQYSPPIGALHVFRGSILLEHDRLAEAEGALTRGLELIRWTGEYSAHRHGYTALARLRAIQEDRPAMLAASSALEEAWPEGALYAQALRHRLSIAHWPDDPDARKEAQAWLSQSGIDFAELAAVHHLDAIGEAHFETYLGAAHTLARLAEHEPGAYSLEGIQGYLKRQQEFARTHGIVSWVVGIAIARSLLFRAAGMEAEGLESLQVAIRSAVPTGLFRIFLNEGDPIRALLQKLRPRLTGGGMRAYVDRLLGAMSRGPARRQPSEGYPESLSEREIEVLRHLAKGLTYGEIGKQLFLSLNTIQFHVKSIYGKLQVNKRMQALERARELHLL